VFDEIMPTEQETRAERLNRQARERNIAILKAKTPDATYIGEYKRYKQWVSDNKQLLELDGEEPRWITRYSIDAYFQHDVVNRKIERESARRVVSGLQWYVINREYCLEEFTVESGVVNACIEVQQEKYVSQLDDSTNDKDPHKDLKDVLPVSKRIDLMTHVYGHRPNDWIQASLCLTYGQNAAVRGASSRKLKLCDLRLSQGFVPLKDGPGARAFMLVLRKGGVHKDRFSTNKQVCTWRHRHYLLCSVFSTALSVIYKLRNAGDEINFKKRTKQRATWWDIALLDWNQYDGK
jgi:hypothetical protein